MKKLISLFTGLLVLLCTAFFLVECENSPKSYYEAYPVEVVGKSVDSDSLKIDIYVDATASMSEFVSNNSPYDRVINQLESSAVSDWKYTNKQFYKFGEYFRLISPNEISSSLRSQTFYSDSRFILANIDSVITRIDTSRVSVVITNLHEIGLQANSVIERIKRKCLEHVQSQIGIAILRINDTNPNKPFYILMFGNLTNSEKLFDHLKKSNGDIIKEENFIVLSRYILKKSESVVTKSPTATTLNFRSSSSNCFIFDMKKEGNVGELIAKISIERNARMLDFLKDNIELVAYKRTSKNENQACQVTSQDNPTKDISLKGVEYAENRVEVTFDLKLSGDSNYGDTYSSYLVYLQTAPRGLVVPPQIKGFATGAVSPEVESFVSGLIQTSSSSIHQPKIAEMYITIKKM